MNLSSLKIDDIKMNGSSKEDSKKVSTLNLKCILLEYYNNFIIF